MGKRPIIQARGKGSMTYRAHSHRWYGEVKHLAYTDEIRNGVIKGKIINLVKCPGHSAPLAVIEYETNEFGFMFAPEMVKEGDEVFVGSKAPVQIGATLPLRNIPEGTNIYNIESYPGDGGCFVRASGTTAKVVMVSNDKILIELPSGKQREFHPECRATVGIIAGAGRKDKPFLKAGKKHWLMRARGKLYPKTSGVAMNAVDHPFGSGRGRHVGKPKNAPRYAPPGRNVGLIRAKKTGRGKKG
ncbi:50S ribosomal protein L2 [Candidatus Woesearchaeota archaeon]|nr:50S ribosomal protein L2 [Candidatus Woesearchaeota archaeon]